MCVARLVPCRRTEGKVVELAHRPSVVSVRFVVTAAPLESLWRRACAPAGSAERAGLPVRCDSSWFVQTFCGGEKKATMSLSEKSVRCLRGDGDEDGGRGGGGGDGGSAPLAIHRSGDDPIWDAVASFNM